MMSKDEVTSLLPHIQALVKALNEDEGYRYGWQANIAMAFVDTMKQNPENSLHENANLAAIHFLKLLTADVKP